MIAKRTRTDLNENLHFLFKHRTNKVRVATIPHTKWCGMLFHIAPITLSYAALPTCFNPDLKCTIFIAYHVFQCHRDPNLPFVLTTGNANNDAMYIHPKCGGDLPDMATLLLGLCRQNRQTNIYWDQLMITIRLCGTNSRVALRWTAPTLSHPTLPTSIYLICANTNKSPIFCHCSKWILRKATRHYKEKLIINCSTMPLQLAPIHHKMLDAFNQSASLSYCHASLFLKDDIFIAVTLNFSATHLTS